MSPIDDIFRRMSEPEKTEVNTYDSPGRGRKQCDSCLVYVGVRNSHCVCGHKFVKKDPVPHVATRSDTGGRGKKYCPDCKMYVGVKTQICPCGYKFNFNKFYNGPKKAKEVVITPEMEVAATYCATLGADKWDKVVYAPSGPCPITFPSISRNDIVEWCDNVVGVGLRTNRVFMPSALKYFAAYTYDRHTPEFEEVCGYIDAWKEMLI
jgi:hypothetical protein